MTFRTICGECCGGVVDCCDDPDEDWLELAPAPEPSPADCWVIVCGFCTETDCSRLCCATTCDRAMVCWLSIIFIAGWNRMLLG